jgi:hypothetical protein
LNLAAIARRNSHSIEVVPQKTFASIKIMRFNKNDTALVVIDPQGNVLSEKATVTMKNVSSTNAKRNDKLDQLSADLASSVYQVTLRATTPQSWLDLELGLWKAISNKLETTYTNSY